LPEAEEAELRALLVAAWRPSELSAEAHERILAMALEDPLAPPTEEELVESARLRDALAGEGSHPDTELLRALSGSFTEPDTQAVDRALRDALEPAAPRARPKRNVIYAAFGGVSVALAAAAAVALFVAGSRSEHTAAYEAAKVAEPELLQARSTAELFDHPFETASTSARMDVIASARSRDLRDNRYAAWGVR
jgi:hypothetical protein